MTYSFFSRSKIVLFCVLIFSLILIAKLFFLQVVHGDIYSKSADRQYSTPPDNIYERGTIFFKSKDGQLISAATQTTGFKIAIDPSNLINIEDVYQKLSKITMLDHKDFIARASKVNDPYEEIANRLSKEQADAVSLFKIPGVSI